MLVTDYLLKAVHTFQIRTLVSRGFQTRVVLSNSSGSTAKYATDYRVDLTVYQPDGRVRETVQDVAVLKQSERRTIDCAPFVKGEPGDCILVFHLIPLRLEQQSRESPLGPVVDVHKEELWALLSAQDHYVEYYREDDGFSSGVLYQSGAFNYDKFSKESTTIIQAPKCYVSKHLNTFFSLMHTSMAPDYRKSAEMRCALVGTSGQRLAQWTETLAPFESRLIDIRAVLHAHDPQRWLGDDPFFCCFYAVCTDATMLPLTFTMNEPKRTLAVEHSLPPLYYGSQVSGPTRARAIRDFAASSLLNTQSKSGSLA
ncbi:MAG: hypothetical protein JNK05_02770 [Myxococcales bacterium]|nr:hypothetical protein [Myxococcales bacterium]